MTPEEIDQILQEVGAPAREYWENELEIGIDAIARIASDEEFLKGWVEKRAKRQLEVIWRNFGMNGAESTRTRRLGLHEAKERLLPYLMVSEFSCRKSKLATVEHARNVLPADLMEICRKSEDEFDTLALCFAIYGCDCMQLRWILHLDKLHKRGAARMIMKDGPRRPERSLGSFMQTDRLAAILREYDRFKGDGRDGELMNVMESDGHCLVFVRRCFRATFIIRGGKVMHGHEPEWIVLDFFDGAKRVNVCSTSAIESLEIANRIASDYYGTDCEYENESEITWEQQVLRLLEDLRQERLEEIVWVELVTSSSPLIGEKPITIGELQSMSIGPAVVDFELKIGPLIDGVDRIESVKVVYRKKRVKLIFEKRDNQDQAYVVRYTDHTLNPLERTAFESYMRLTHGIPVLSTEKRFKNPA